MKSPEEQWLLLSLSLFSTSLSRKRTFIYSEDTILFRKVKETHPRNSSTMARSKNAGVGETRRAPSCGQSKGAEGGSLGNRFHPRGSLRCTLFLLRSTFLSKNICFSPSQASARIRLSRETGFPALNPPTSFLRVSRPPDPLRAFAFDGPAHLSVCERGFSTKCCTPLGCRIYRYVTLRRGGWLANSAARTKRFLQID